MGVERIPNTGERDGADARTPLFVFQFKLRRAIPVWLWDWMMGIRQTADAAGGERIGVLVLKRPGMRDDDALAIVKWKDWVELHGEEQDG